MEAVNNVDVVGDINNDVERAIEGDIAGSAIMKVGYKRSVEDRGRSKSLEMGNEG